MRRSVKVTTGMCHTLIKFTESDKPGPPYEVSASPTNLRCNMVNCEEWNYNTRAKAILQVTDEENGVTIAKPSEGSDDKERPDMLLIGKTTTTSVVAIWCKDRQKLMFCIICTLAGMQHVVFLSNVGAEVLKAY
ncbi:ACT domain-containing protein ACR4-like [Lycium ferocissimum]|uniref:ACT domain-containing protein ACR4-like n=1 Tax=Lycium ferocissimum TaxID=112874 RepID=UPI002814C98B|nr:ACT domain-containing protein ACR4-like [Lycium ferocissimum]